MIDIAHAFLDQSRHLLLADYLPKIEKCLEALSDDDVWWRPNEAELLASLKTTLGEVDDVLAGVNAESLLTKRQIQDCDGTILEAIYHVVEHFGMHTGQIITLTKIRAGKDLSLWRPRAATKA
jgi:hypothetical protein